MRTGKKYFKDGNPEIFAFINDITWKRMTDREKAHWTPFSDVDKAPIPKEVIEFNRLRDESAEKEQALQDRIKELENQLAEGKDDTTDVQPPIPKPKEVQAVQPTVDPEIYRQELLTKCTEKGIKTTHNMKVETLEKKLADAND